MKESHSLAFATEYNKGLAKCVSGNERDTERKQKQPKLKQGRENHPVNFNLYRNLEDLILAMGNIVLLKPLSNVEDKNDFLNYRSVQEGNLFFIHKVSCSSFKK